MILFWKGRRHAIRRIGASASTLCHFVEREKHQFSSHLADDSNHYCMLLQINYPYVVSLQAWVNIAAGHPNSDQVTDADLIQFCRVQGLAGFKIPRRIHLQVESLPMNASGKILKQNVKEILSRDMMRSASRLWTSNLMYLKLCDLQFRWHLCWKACQCSIWMVTVWCVLSIKITRHEDFLLARD